MPLNVDKINTGNLTIGQSEITPELTYLNSNQVIFGNISEFIILGNPGGNKNSTYKQYSNFITLDVNVNQLNSMLTLGEAAILSTTNTTTGDLSGILLYPTEMYLETLTLVFKNLPMYADNSEAVSDGYPSEGVYKTPTGELRIVTG